MNHFIRSGQILTRIFNFLLFSIVFGVIIVSLVVVFGNEDRGIFGKAATPTISEAIAVANDQPLDGDGVRINHAIEIPPAELLTKIELPLVDTLLTNPGIGWIYRWSSRRSSEIPSTVTYGERGEISWKILNPGEDTYNW